MALAGLVVLAGCPRNRPPLPPFVEAPTIAQRGDSLRVRVSSYDADSDSLWFLLDWGDGEGSGWVGPLEPGAKLSLAHAYQDTGFYGVRAQAKDAALTSDWSEASPVHVGEYGPGVPHRPSGPETVPVGDSATYVTLAGHPLAKQVSIQFDWGDTVGDWGRFIAAGEFYSARHAFRRGGTMLVRARARDTLEQVSDWSKPKSVIVVDTFMVKQPGKGRTVAPARRP